MAWEQWISGFLWHQNIMVTQYWPRTMSFFPHLAQLYNLDFTLSCILQVQTLAVQCFRLLIIAVQYDHRVLIFGSILNIIYSGVQKVFLRFWWESFIFPMLTAPHWLAPDEPLLAGQGFCWTSSVDLKFTEYTCTVHWCSVQWPAAEQWWSLECPQCSYTLIYPGGDL